MVEGAGFGAIDLGAEFRMKAISKALEDAGRHASTKIMVSGAPVTEAFAREIGADAFAPDAASAVDVARESSG